MTVMWTATPTTDPWRISDLYPTAFRRTSPSTFNVDLVDRRILDVLAGWDESIARNLDDGTGSDFPTTAVEAVTFLREFLQLPQEQVLQAVGVSPRSFYQWANGSVTRPRPASLGRLWPTVQALAPLQTAHPNFAAWFHSTPAAQASFAAGQINRLLTIEFEWASNSQRVQLRSLPAFGDPGDPYTDVSDANTNQDGSASYTTSPLSIRRSPRVRARRGQPE